MNRTTLDRDGSAACFVPDFDTWSTASPASHGSRAELLALAASKTPDVDVSQTCDPSTPVICAGHQPLLYHPGIQAKSFALREAAERFGGVAVDVIVDTDVAHYSFDCLDLSADPRRVSISLIEHESARSMFRDTPEPSLQMLDRWSSDVRDVVSTLGLRSCVESVERYLQGAREVSGRGGDLGRFSVLARRRFERPAHISPLVLYVSDMLGSNAWSAFLMEILADATTFAQHYNRALDTFRTSHSTRSAAQPFPDLTISDTEVELPFWIESPEGRSTLSLLPDSRGVKIRAGEGTCFELHDGGQIEQWAKEHASTVSPKAIMLTAFLRTRFCDLFIHGTGGYRYDEVCDTLIRSYWGVDPAPRVSATADVYLPISISPFVSTDYSAARERVNRVRQHPEEFLFDADLPEPELTYAQDLAAEKDGLVAAITHPGADRKMIGARIKELNARLSDVLSSYVGVLQVEAESVRSHVDASKVLRDRALSFPLFDPREVEFVVMRGLVSVDPLRRTPVG